MVGGSYTHSVLGVAKSFSYTKSDEQSLQYQNCRRIVEQYGTAPNFCTLIEPRTVNGVGALPEVTMVLSERLKPKKKVRST